MASSVKSGFHLWSGRSPSLVVRRRAGWAGDKPTAPPVVPPHLGALAELLWHEVQATVSMVTSHFDSTSFTQHAQAVNWPAFKKKKN